MGTTKVSASSGTRRTDVARVSSLSPVLMDTVNSMPIGGYTNGSVAVEPAATNQLSTRPSAGCCRSARRRAAPGVLENPVQDAGYNVGRAAKKSCMPLTINDLYPCRAEDGLQALRGRSRFDGASVGCCH